MDSFLFALVAAIAFAPAARAASPRVVKTINRDWTFQYFPSPDGDARTAAPTYDDSSWPAIALPHTWSTYETTGDLHPFIRSATERDDTYWWFGWGWYRKHFTIGRESSDRLVALEFDGVQKYSRIYLNGHYVGEHKGGYTGFSFDISRWLNPGGDNVLAVQVSNRRDDPFGGIPPMTAGNFDVYGGIYRDVRLVITDRLHVPYQGSAAHEGGTFVTTPAVSADSATIQVRTWVGNDYPQALDCSLTSILVDADGRELSHLSTIAHIAAGEIHEFGQLLPPLPKPRLWSPDDPYLYRIRTEVRQGNRLADTYESPLGIRWFHWDYAQNRMYLNGKMTLLRGINRHQEFPWLGDAMPKWMHDEDLEDIRHGMGLNFQRTVHYPHDPHTYDMCDRLGFMLIEESPNIKDIAFGRDIQHADLIEAIRRDRNHPSILIWSMGNETNQPADSAWGAAEDPTRIIYLRRGENGGTHVQLTDHNLPIENLLRCTVRGWYGKDDHDFGEEGPEPESSQVTGTEDWQYEKCVTSGRLTDQNVVVWLYADHGADRNYLDSPLRNINPKGWKDAYRFPKYVYYLWQANFTSKPMAYIHPTWWRERFVGQTHDVVVDSNCEEVELTLDGRSLGRQRPTAAHARSVTFPGVKVVRGTLVAHGRNRGQPAAEWRLPLAGAPARLVLTAAPLRITADRAGISVASLDIVDAHGEHVYGANPPLTWSVEGPARLVGPAVYRTDTAKNGAREGTMYIDAPVANVIRSSAEPGLVRIRVSAPGYAPAEVTVESVAPQNDAVPGIAEPALADAGRSRVRRDRSFQPLPPAAKSGALHEIMTDLEFKPGTPESYRHQIQAFLKERNPHADVFSLDYRTLVEQLTRTTVTRGGHLIVDDFNFDIRAYNEKLAKKK